MPTIFTKAFFLHQELIQSHYVLPLDYSGFNNMLPIEPIRVVTDSKVKPPTSYTPTFSYFFSLLTISFSRKVETN